MIGNGLAPAPVPACVADAECDLVDAVRALIGAWIHAGDRLAAWQRAVDRAAQPVGRATPEMQAVGAITDLIEMGGRPDREMCLHALKQVAGEHLPALLAHLPEDPAERDTVLDQLFGMWSSGMIHAAYPMPEGVRA